MPASLTQCNSVELALDDDSGVLTPKEIDSLTDLNIRHLQCRLVLLVFLTII